MHIIKYIYIALFSLVGSASLFAQNILPSEAGDIVITEIGHASFNIQWNDISIYVDPVGEAYQDMPSPNLILLTDIHGDHFNTDTLMSLRSPTTIIIAPNAVFGEVFETAREISYSLQGLANGETLAMFGVNIEAIPMYNLTEERLMYHNPGRGNGYVLTLGGTRIYISGDTEDIPEMRALENIDAAFICFNLPYTMTEQQAASAVNEFSPGIVFPYHYRGSDVALFESLINDEVEVRILDNWY
jgi:L-ascorbate metabolism protein UlaG (beta-lactamase superfamily)